MSLGGVEIQYAKARTSCAPVLNASTVGVASVIEWFDKTYEKGKKLGKKAMMALEDRLDRLARLPKWFVDIAPAPA